MADFTPPVTNIATNDSVGTSSLAIEASSPAGERVSDPSKPTSTLKRTRESSPDTERLGGPEEQHDVEPPHDDAGVVNSGRGRRIVLVRAAQTGSPAPKRRLGALSSGGEEQSNPSPSPDSTTPALLCTSSDAMASLPPQPCVLPALSSPSQPAEQPEQPVASSSSPKKPIRALKASDKYRILHQISCNSSCHDGQPMVFSQKPRWTHHDAGYDDGVHLIGSRDCAVDNLPSFVHDAGDILFLAVHYYRCDDSTNLRHIQTRSADPDDQPGAPTAYRQGVLVISHSLQIIIDNLSTYESDPAAYWPSPNGSSGYQGISESREGRSRCQHEYSMIFFYHHAARVKKAYEEASSVEDRAVLYVLMSYIRRHLRHQWIETDTLLGQGLVPSHSIELIFCPNAMVITKIDGITTACILRSWPTGGSIISFDCWVFADAGNVFLRKPITLTINRPTAYQVAFQDLEVIPGKLISEDIFNSLELNGRKVWNLRNRSIVTCEGWDANNEEYHSSEERFMIDYSTYHHLYPKAEAFQFQTKPKVSFDLWPTKLEDHETPLRRHFMLMPSRINGFSFRTKRWYSLFVYPIREVQWNKSAFEQLVLPSRIKDTIKSRFIGRIPSPGVDERQKLQATRRHDFIASKGRGFIMRLCGRPGTGKTLTAECVAELAEMPLYNVACGDLPSQPALAEKYLQTALLLAKRWNCILLIDESDVFQELQSSTGLKKIVFISSQLRAFFRALHDHDGISILTSNQAEVPDAAIASHVAMNLQYLDLQHPDRRQIWENFFDMVKADKKGADVDGLMLHTDQLSLHELNGRQIRDVFTTARQLALSKKERLCWNHIVLAMDVVANLTW